MQSVAAEVAVAVVAAAEAAAAKAVAAADTKEVAAADTKEAVVADAKEMVAKAVLVVTLSHLKPCWQQCLQWHHPRSRWQQQHHWSCVVWRLHAGKAGIRTIWNHSPEHKE